MTEALRVAARRLLVTTISNLGLEVDSVQHSARVYDKTKPLLATLKGMHAGQGIGLLV